MMSTLNSWLGGAYATAAVVALPCAVGAPRDPMGWGVLAAALLGAWLHTSIVWESHEST